MNSVINLELYFDSNSIGTIEKKTDIPHCFVGDSFATKIKLFEEFYIEEDLEFEFFDVEAQAAVFSNYGNWLSATSEGMTIDDNEMNVKDIDDFIRVLGNAGWTVNFDPEALDRVRVKHNEVRLKVALEAAVDKIETKFLSAKMLPIAFAVVVACAALGSIAYHEYWIK